jgi:hypothetical protein
VRHEQTQVGAEYMRPNTALDFAQLWISQKILLVIVLCWGWRSLWLTVNIWCVGHLFGHQCKELFLFLMHYLTVPGV